MYWYGWTATSMIGGAVLGVLATFLPEPITRKNPAGARLDRSAAGDPAAILFGDALLDALAAMEWRISSKLPF